MAGVRDSDYLRQSDMDEIPKYASGTSPVTGKRFVPGFSGSRHTAAGSVETIPASTGAIQGKYKLSTGT